MALRSSWDPRQELSWGFTADRLSFSMLKVKKEIASYSWRIAITHKHISSTNPCQWVHSPDHCPNLLASSASKVTHARHRVNTESPKFTAFSHKRSIKVEVCQTREATAKNAVSHLHLQHCICYIQNIHQHPGAFAHQGDLNLCCNALTLTMTYCEYAQICETQSDRVPLNSASKDM